MIFPTLYPMEELPILTRQTPAAAYDMSKSYKYLSEFLEILLNTITCPEILYTLKEMSSLYNVDKLILNWLLSCEIILNSELAKTLSSIPSDSTIFTM